MEATTKPLKITAMSVNNRVDRLESVVDCHDEDIERHNIFIEGNGKIGAKTIIYDMERRVSNIEKLTWVIAGGVLTSLIKLFFGT